MSTSDADQKTLPHPMESLEPWAIERSRKAARSFMNCCEQIGFELPTNILGMAATDMELLARAVLIRARGTLNIFEAMWRDAEAESDRLRATIAALEKRVSDLEEVLEPFAEAFLEGNEDFPDSTKVTVTGGRSIYYALTLKDFRDALTVLNGAALSSDKPERTDR